MKPKLTACSVSDMNVVSVFNLIEKGINIISTLYDSGVDVTNAIEALRKLAEAAKKGSVSQSELELTEKILDEMIDDFNLD